MSKLVFLIDSFSAPLSNEEAAEYFKTFIKFDGDNNLEDESHQKFLNFEEKIYSVYLKLIKYCNSNVSVVLTDNLVGFISSTPWAKERLRSYEYEQLRSLSMKYTNSKVIDLAMNELKLFVTLGCRELLFPTFIIGSTEMGIKDENVVLVSSDNSHEIDFIKLEVKKHGLYIRPVINN